MAAIVAHKFWPKGMIYGGKEEWETKVDKVKDKVKEKVFGQDDYDDGDHRYRDRYPPRRGDRGRSRDGMVYYEHDRLAVERAPEPPLLRSRSMRDRDGRGRSLDAPRRRVYQEVDTIRGGRYVPRQQLQDLPRTRREQTFTSDRYYYQRGDTGQYIDRDDEVVVVKGEGSRRGGRGYR